jgi:hypothetical protein
LTPLPLPSRLSCGSGQTSSTPRANSSNWRSEKGLSLITAESYTSRLLSVIPSEAPGAGLRNGAER